MIVLGFYKYVEIEDPLELMKSLKEFCNHEQYRGTILVAAEGINASVSGNRESIDSFREYLTSDSRFENLFFKEETTLNEHPFKKMMIRVKKEIVRFDCEVDLKNSGKHISPEEFVDLYDSEGNLREDIILLDTRNDYEYEVGRFKGATHVNLKTFREFTKRLDIEKIKDKKVVMYCTGGVRCEKATAYVKEQGVKEVYQLHQGIIRFGKEFQDSVWEGKCFVFDKRMHSPMNASGEVVSNCFICGKVCDFLRNCKNEICNKFHVACIECQENMNKCCSVDCRKEVLKRTSI